LINLVDTDYVLQADNDDFYVLEEISNLIDFLDINTNYVGARGALVNLYFNGIKDCGKNATCTKYILNKVFSSSIEQDSTLDRIDFLFKNMSLYDFYSNWYCVFRTTSLQKTWNSILPLKISEMVVTEISFHIYILSYGKLKIFDNPFYIRQSGSSIHGDTLVIGNEFLERFFIENNFVLDLDKALSNAEFLNYKEKQLEIKKFR
jgi:glycosyltransferase domain-containing protein